MPLVSHDQQGRDHLRCLAHIRGLDLREYEAIFRDNAIDEKVIPNLTAKT
jgi:hypothetical protein